MQHIFPETPEVARDDYSCSWATRFWVGVCHGLNFPVQLNLCSAANAVIHEGLFMFSLRGGVSLVGSLFQL